MNVEPSVIRAARQADLPSYLRSRGEVLIKDGPNYHLKEHDSLQIRGNMYFWNSRGTSGNALSFVQEFYGLPFLEAIKELTGEGVTLAASRPAAAEGPKALVMPTKADNARRVYAYLTQTRGISHDVLQLCFDRHLIYQDTNGNAVFKMTDTAGEVVGAELNGTGEKRFKGIAGGSKPGYGFSVTLGAEPSRMCVFESAVDLLSYATLYGDKLNSHVLVSMEGLKEQTLLTMAKLHGIPLHNVWCCVDADDAGISFANRMKAAHGIKAHLPPVKAGAKDWNDVCKSQRKKAGY